MPELIELAAFIAMVDLSGIQLLRLVSRRRDRGWLEFLSVSYLLGSLLVAATCFLVSLAGFSLKLPAVAIVLALFIGLGELLIRLVQRRSDPALTFPPPAGKPPLRLLDGILLALILAASLYLLMQSFLTPLNQWDSWAMWSLKAKVLLAQPIRSNPYFHDASLSYSHLDYPLLLPLLQAATWLALGRQDQTLVLVPLTLIFLSFQAAAYYRLKEFTGRPPALLLIACLSWVPLLQRQTPLGLADVPLMVFQGMSVLYLLSWLREKRTDALVLAALMATSAAFTKNEGLALLAVNAAALLLLVLLGPERKHILKGLGLYLLVATICLLPWLAFRLTISGMGPDFQTSQTAMSLADYLHRLPTIFWAILVQAVSWKNWGPFWPAFLVVVLLGARSLIRRGNLFLATLFLLQLTSYVVAYMLTRRDLTWQINYSLDRLILQTLPVALALMALQFQSVVGKREPEAT